MDKHQLISAIEKEQMLASSSEVAVVSKILALAMKLGDDEPRRQVRVWAKNWLNIEHAKNLIATGEKEKVKILHLGTHEAFVITIEKAKE